MNNTPIFSVIMACHNAAPYVQQAIESVKSQTFSNWELIIVDDASQDDSLAYIKKASISEPRIKVISMAINVGAAAARNAAIEIAKGEWLSILDADDVYLSYKLEKQFEIIQQDNTNLVLLGGGCFHINSEGIRSREYKYPSNSKVLKTNLHGRLKFPPHSSIVYRKSAFLTVGYFNQLFTPSEDYELWLRISEIGELSSCALPLIEYRIHTTNISNQISKQGFTQIDYGTAARVCQLLRNNGQIDPSATGNDQLWVEFMTHVAMIIRQSKYYNYCDWRSNFKQNMQRSSTFLDKSLVVITNIVRSPASLLYLIRERIFGTDLIDKIFKSWTSK